MGGNEITLTDIKKTYTFNEAVEYVKEKERHTTDTDRNTSWIDVNTGKEVIIAYSS